MDKHNLLGNDDALLDGAETNDGTGARVRLLVPMGHTHASTDGDVETSEFTLLVNNGDETDVIGKDIYVVVRRDRNGDLELWAD